MPLPRLALFAFATLFATVGRGQAQSVSSRGHARIVGTVVDSATGRPIVRTRICREVELDPPPARGIVCTTPDETGRYVFDSLAAGPLILTASCAGAGFVPERTLAHDTLLVAEGEERRLDIRGHGAGCNMRPFIVRRGVFEGHYRSGFEESTFRPCSDSISAWAELSGAVIRSGPEWPKRKEYYATYFVRWRGTLRGPWRYGHMGMSSYEIRVDSILVVRRPRRSDCR